MATLKLFFSKLFLLIFFVMLVEMTFGQDVLYYYSGNKAIGKVIDLTDKDVVFKVSTNDSTEKAVIIDKSQIKSISYEGKPPVDLHKKGDHSPGNTSVAGKYSSFVQPKIDYESELNFNLTSIFADYVEVGYEKSLRKNLGIELSVGIIGLMDNNFGYDRTYLDHNPDGELVKYGNSLITSRSKGFTFNIGPKLMLRNHNSLKGLYVKPEFVYSRISLEGTSFGYNGPGYGDDYDFHWKFKGGSAGILIRVGYQFLLTKRISLDINGGYGLAGSFGKYEREGSFKEDSWIKEPLRNHMNWYNHIKADGVRSVSGAIKIGFLL